jgi:DNA invertase Pin-like site-specific DNA recombinase
MKYGYARVSTDGQTLDAQLAELKAAGAEKIFREKASGAKADRAQLRHVIGQLAKGDLLLVTRLDRLARSTRDLLNILDAITSVGARFRSLHDTWADTTTAHGRLMLTVLGGLAEFEREDQCQNQRGAQEREGARRPYGQTPKLTHQRAEALEALEEGDDSIGSTCGRIYSGNGTLSGSGGA